MACDASLSCLLLAAAPHRTSLEAYLARKVALFSWLLPALAKTAVTLT